MRNFYEEYKYRWEITNEYGYPVSKEDLRDNRIEQVLNNKPNINLHYMVHLKKNDEVGWGQYIGLYKPREKKLSIYPLGGEVNVRVSYISEDIEECEMYIDLVCRGNNMDLAPISIKQ